MGKTFKVKDKRRLLRASPPDRHPKFVTIQMSPAEYERVYDYAFDRHLSLSDAVRELIRKKEKSK